MNEDSYVANQNIFFLVPWMPTLEVVHCSYIPGFSLEMVNVDLQS